MQQSPSQFPCNVKAYMFPEIKKKSSAAFVTAAIRKLNIRPHRHVHSEIEFMFDL